MHSPQSAILDTQAPTMSSKTSTSKKQERPAVTSRQTMQGHTGMIRDVVYLSGGRHIITCSEDGSVRLWDLESGTQIGNDWREKGTQLGVCIISLSPNSNTVASGNQDGIVTLWDVETGKAITKWTGHTDWVRSVSWRSDGERAVSGSDDGTARVWDVESGETVLTIETGHEWVLTVMYSPDDTKIATGGQTQTAVKIWDAKSGELLTALAHVHGVYGLTWMSDGRKLISASLSSIRIYDTATWKQTAAILKGPEDNFANALSLSQNNRLLATGSDKTAQLWNLNTNLPVGPPLQHDDVVACAAFSADGKVLVTASSKNSYAWDVHVILQEAGLEDLLLPIPHILARKSLMNSDATRRPATHARRIPPGFFDVVPDGAQSSTARGTHPHSPAHHPHSALALSSANLRALLGRFSSLLRHTQPNTDGATELQQRQRQSIFSRGPRIVEVAAVQDRKALAVARRPERERAHTQTAGTTALGAKPAQSRLLRPLALLVLFLCCASPQHTDGNAKPTQQQQSQSQGQVQPQASSSQTQPATATSTSPPVPATSTTTPNAATAQSQSLPLRARFVLFLCCASLPHADGH